MSNRRAYASLLLVPLALATSISLAGCTESATSATPSDAPSVSSSSTPSRQPSATNSSQTTPGGTGFSSSTTRLADSRAEYFTSEDGQVLCRLSGSLGATPSEGYGVTCEAIGLRSLESFTIAYLDTTASARKRAGVENVPTTFYAESPVPRDLPVLHNGQEVTMGSITCHGHESSRIHCWHAERPREVLDAMASHVEIRTAAQH